MLAVAEKPDLTPDEIRLWLWENYSIDGCLEPLPGERDLNFKLSTESGESFVCKISSALHELGLLEAQNEVLTLLEQKELAALPGVLTSHRGENLIPLNAGGQRYLGRVLTFVPGKVLANCAPYSAPLLRDFGRTIGSLNLALEGYDHPSFHYSFDWDLANAMDVTKRYGEFISDPDLRDGVERVYRDYANVVVPRFAQLRKGVIHNDANDYNVLAEGDRITGVIDFGDMVHSYTICDLAIAMAYATLAGDDTLGLLEEMAVGYHDSMPIKDDELVVLFPMMRMRLAVSACMAAHQMRLRPDDPYLSISQEPIRKTLPRLLEFDLTDVHQMLKESLA